MSATMRNKLKVNMKLQPILLAFFYFQFRVKGYSEEKAEWDLILFFQHPLVSVFSTVNNIFMYPHVKATY